MKDFKKSSCVGCGECFDDESDIVVCPVCGAPHHRTCWKEQGHCAYEDRHAEGYEWQPEKIYIGEAPSDEPVIPPDETEQVVCPNCGKSTAKKDKYCKYCGYYIYEEADPFAEAIKNDNLEELFPFDAAEKIQGVPAGDMKRFVGSMWIYYIPRFIRMSRNNSPVSFNFTAFFTHGFWFVSRKMYIPGVMMIMTVVGTTLFQAYLSSIADGLSGNRLALASMMSLILSGVEIVIMMISGLFGNRFYMNFCARKVKKINKEATAQKADADQFNRALESSGGLGILPAVSMVICYLVILYITRNGILF